ncbi:hypothetical protein E4K10_21160 [Streptomyces sp. T1317-0309]|nr:hypothetical protein E4K10_21160 [Streptomyces sp. T1317-0309]
MAAQATEGDGAGEAGDGFDGSCSTRTSYGPRPRRKQSARARMLAARWRNQAPDPQPWRSDEPPAGWFFSKARRRRWRRR